MLPEAVEKQAKLAEDLHRQVYGNTEQAEAPPAPEVEEPKAEKPAEVQPAAEAPPPTVEKVPPEVDESFKRKFEVLQGKYSAEVPRMAAEIRDLKAKLAQAEAAPKAKEPTAQSRLKPEEIEEYGENFVDFVKRAAADSVPNDVDEMRATVEQLKGETVRLAKDRFFSDLNRMAPQWESLNEDKAFLTWLSGIDPFSGRIRSEMFDDASQSLDAWRVANFFNSYRGEQEPEPQEPDLLAQQVEPPTTKVSSPPPGKKTWKTSEIAAFYAAVREGKLPRAEADRIENDIFVAQSEGRIVNR
jgi:hypothetical protein